MQTTLFNHPKLSVQVRTGSEGPHYDPYAFMEFQVKTPDGLTVLHEGLGTWLKFNGQEFPRVPNQTYDEYERHVREVLFQRCTGFSVKQLTRIHRKLKSRCHHCGGNLFRAERGYPGEHFEICCGCGNVHDSYFNISEIE